MTDNGSNEGLSEAEAGVATEAEAPAPEPWTPARVLEWNRYYDLYVAGFVVLLAFLGSANKIPAGNSAIWSLLQAGRQISEAGAPVVTDRTSIAGDGQPWVNIPWLYEVSHYAIFQAAASLGPKGEIGAPAALVANARDQYGAGALIAVDSLARGLTALLLLGLRRKGPGLWWAALCSAMALGVTLGPATIEQVSATATGEVVRSVRPWIGIQIGGIASPASVVVPESWGLLLLAVELLLLHQAINLGKAGRLYGLVPLFLLWANVDESFSFGLVILAASTIGLAIAARRDPARASSRPAWIALGLALAATFANPSHVHGVMAAFDSMLKPIAALPKSLGLVERPASFRSTFLFSTVFGPAGLDEIAKTLRFYFLALVGLGLASFLINRRDFSVPRFLAFLAAAALWSLSFNAFTGTFALVLAATLALNGQDWYQRTFGVDGRMGIGWTFWSTGGRLVTIAATGLAIASGVTGWHGQVGDPQFGFGFNPDDFPFESAEAIRNAPIEGGILNTSLPQGDAIAWKAASKRKAYVDSRTHLYPPSVFDDLRELRTDLKNDDLAKWQPVLDRLKISAVMIQPKIGNGQDLAKNTYAKLMGSPNWVPFYDDGTVVIFGRVDPKANPADVAYFRANRLDADELVYKRPKLVAPWQRTPTPTELIDTVFQNRLLNRPQPHTAASLNWLEPANMPAGQLYLPDPAHCLMAIREARAALSAKPDDSIAFQILYIAYQRLMAQESALIQGIALTQENIAKISQVTPLNRVLVNRQRQLMTALNFRLQTLTPARTPDEQANKANINYALAQLYLQSGFLDLARDRLSLIADEALTSGLSDQFLTNLNRQNQELGKRFEQVRTQMEDLAINRRASPLDKALFARGNGAPGLAIKELEDVNDAGGNVPGVRPLLVDLYNDTGQPEKALEVILNLNVDDPTLSSGIGTASYRQGLVYDLLGNYTNAAGLWLDRAINPLRTKRSMDAISAAQVLLAGEPIPAVKTLLDLPEKVNIQAEWELELGMTALEGGLPPEFVADHLQNALKLEPNLTARPVVAYYLEKLGKPVPPAPKIATPTPPPAETKPAESTPKPDPTPVPTPDLPTIPPPADTKPELPPEPFAKDPAKP
jgi:hypothetical protein